jgi:hypothetical protein
MNTVDTTKLWTLVPGTDNTWSEIVGAGGICMDVFEATTEQAQEICDMLNGPTRAGACSVTYQTGDQEVTYSAPHADEAMWMAERGEQRQESGPVNITLNVAGITREEAGELADRAEQDTCAEAADLTPGPVYYTGGARREGKSDYVHIVMIENLQKQVADLSQALDNALAERDDLTQQLQRATGEANAWHETAAQQARDAEFYRDLIDRCARALGQEAFTADDGSVNDSPIRLKVPELVENLVQGRSAYTMVGVGEAHYVYGKSEAIGAVRAAVERVKELEAKTQCCMGVGTGGGQLFVYGNHESIKAAQAIVLRVGGLAKNNDLLNRALESASLPEMMKAPVMAVSASDGYFLRFPFGDRRQLRRAHEQWIAFCQAARGAK